MKEFNKYVGLDTHKDTIAVAISEIYGGKPSVVSRKFTLRSNTGIGLYGSVEKSHRKFVGTEPER